MSLPQIHPREKLVAQAGNKISQAIDDIDEEFGLTTVELLQILIGYQATTLKYALRMERHGNTDTPAGWASEEGEPS